MSFRKTAFDEIGYFVYKMGIVKFTDILDIYPQAVRVWNIVFDIVQTLRKVYEDDTTFIYFEMLVRQEKFEVKPDFGTAKKLYS